MYNKGLFADWVPKPAQLVLVLVFLLPILVINGVYTGNIGYMAGSLGMPNSWLVFANYAGVVGMGVSMPVIFRYKLAFYTKYLMLRTFLVLALLSFIIGTTDSVGVIVICTFFIGFFKMFALIEVIMPVMMMISPKGDRAQFYGIFYPAAIIIPQVVGYLATRVGFFSFWENMHFYMAVIMLFCALLSVVFMHNLRYDKKVSLKGVDWWGLFLYTSIFIAIAYFVSFAKQLNYFRSENIMLSAVVIVVGIIFYAIHQRKVPMPFVDFRTLKNYNVIHGIMMLFMLGFFLAGSSLQSKITQGILGYSTVLDNSFNLWMIPGIALGSIFSLLWLTKNRSLKIYILTGFTSFLVYYVLMYFLVSPNLSYELLILPNILRGFGMAVLFIGVWLYALSSLSMEATLGVAAVLIITRTMLGPAIWSLAFNYIDSIWNLEVMTNFAGKLDASAFSKQGAMNLYKNLNLDALMISTKRIYGLLVLLGGAVLIYVSFLNLEGLGKRKLVLLRKRLKGQSVKGYKREVESNNEEEIKTEATAASGTAV